MHGPSMLFHKVLNFKFNGRNVSLYQLYVQVIIYLNIHSY